MYEAASTNHKEITKALTQLERSIKRAIRDNDDGAVEALTPAQLLLVSVKAEARLIKILHQPDGFSAGERDRVLAEEKAVERWLSVVDIAFRKHYAIKGRHRLEDRLDHDSLARRDTLIGLINNELNLVISLRNKLAHGQWVYPFNSTLSAVEPQAVAAMTNETTLSLQYRDNLVRQLGNAITQLVDSGTAFEKNFDVYFEKIRDNRRYLENHSFADWILDIRRTKVAIAPRPDDPSAGDGQPG